MCLVREAQCEVRLNVRPQNPKTPKSQPPTRPLAQRNPEEPNQSTLNRRHPDPSPQAPATQHPTYYPVPPTPSAPRRIDPCQPARREEGKENDLKNDAPFLPSSLFLRGRALPQFVVPTESPLRTP